MSYKMNFFKFVAIIGVGMLLGSTVSAQQSIPGTFYGADTSNTTAQGGGAFASGTNAAGLWFDGSGNTGSIDNRFAITGGNSGSSSTATGGYQAGPNDTDIVTTVGGLNTGDVYSVNFIYSGVFGNTSFPFSVGLSPTSTSQVLNGGSFAFGDILAETSNSSFLRVVSEGLGNATVDGNGDISVFVNLIDPNDPGVFYSGNQAYNGVSLELVSSVPEPSSAALLLGLGGLALARRRR